MWALTWAKSPLWIQDYSTQPASNISIAGSTERDIKALWIISSEMVYQNTTTMTLKGTVYLYKALNFWSIFPLSREKSFKSQWVTGLNPGTPLWHCSSSARAVLHTLPQGKGQPTAARLSNAFQRIYLWAKIAWYGSLKFEGMGWGQEERGKNLGMSREERRWCGCVRKCACPVFL